MTTWLREAVSDGDGLADMAYIVIGALAVSAMLSLGFIFGMSAISYGKCQPITTVAKGEQNTTSVIPCNFDPLPVGQAAGLIFAAFGALIGSLAGYMAATRKQPRVIAPPAQIVNAPDAQTINQVAPASGRAAKRTGKGQRGLGLIEMLIWAAIAAAVVAFAIGAFEHFIAEPLRKQGDVRTETRLQPIIAGLTKQRDEALAANKDLTKDVGDLRASVTLVQIAWAKADKAAATAQAESRRLFAELAKVKAAAAAEIQGLQDIINRPPSAELCGGICARARDLLLSFTAEPDRVPGQ